MQHGDRGTARGSRSFNSMAIKAEMFRPFLIYGMKEWDILAALGIERLDTIGFI
jgi:hypothetical protein